MSSFNDLKPELGEQTEEVSMSNLNRILGLEIVLEEQPTHILEKILDALKMDDELLKLFEKARTSETSDSLMFEYCQLSGEYHALLLDIKTEMKSSPSPDDDSTKTVPATKLTEWATSIRQVWQMLIDAQSEVYELSTHSIPCKEEDIKTFVHGVCTHVGRAQGLAAFGAERIAKIHEDIGEIQPLDLHIESRTSDPQLDKELSSKIGDLHLEGEEGSLEKATPPAPAACAVQ